MFSEYTLYVNISNNPIILKSIPNITLTSPQSYSFTYKDILDNQESYDLSSSISLKNSKGNVIPYWIEESKSEYIWSINTLFNPKEATEYDLYFQVTDYWGDIIKTDQFRITVLPNAAPLVANRPTNKIFYKGQLEGVIHMPDNMFVDPGDTFKIYTNIWIEEESQSVDATYLQSNNSILVTYPKSFVGIWTIGIVAKDSGDNYLIFLYKITIAEWGQTSWSKCTSSLIQSCSECGKNHILNLKTGEWVPILNIYSLGSIKAIGMIMFFFLFLHFLVSLWLINNYSTIIVI